MTRKNVTDKPKEVEFSDLVDTNPPFEWDGEHDPFFDLPIEDTIICTNCGASVNEMYAVTCDDCKGTGITYFNPGRAECLTCDGQGVLWSCVGCRQ